MSECLRCHEDPCTIMPLWLAIVISAHLLNAGAFLVDKVLLARAVPSPVVYAFFVGMLGAVGFVLLPFDPQLPMGAGEWAVDLAAGATFVVALLAFFTALRRGEASRIVPYVGGTIPVWTFILAYLFLDERLPQRALVAFAILVLGSALIARESGGRATGTRRHAYGYASLAAVAFAVSAVLMKAVFLSQSFASGFAWSRLGSVLAAAALLLAPSARRAITASRQQPRSGNAALFLGGQIAGALGFFALQYAISVASPTLVNALQGVQYAFLFMLAAVLGRRFPQLHERLTRAVVMQKLIAIIVVAFGLVLLTDVSLVDW